MSSQNTPVRKGPRANRGRGGGAGNRRGGGGGASRNAAQRGSNKVC
jgi:hypothetical protein